MLVLSGTGTDRQAGRQTDGQGHVLSQADALTKNHEKFLSHTYSALVCYMVEWLGKFPFDFIYIFVKIEKKS